MGTSYVEYKGFGFWTRDSFLESWLTTMIGEMQRLPSLENWQSSLIGHWHLQTTIDSGCMRVGLDDFLVDEGRRQFLLALAKRSVGLSSQTGRRTGELFVCLLEEKLNTTSSSPIDYFEDPG